MSRLVDARVSTPEWNPAEQDAYFEEPVLRYEGPLVAVDELPDVPAELSAPPEGAPCFVNLSDGYRITRRTFACWMDVLRRRSGASLWLAEGTDLRRERLRAAADEAGVDPSRITFRSDGPLSKGYAFAAADAWLDGLDIGAGTSGILCAWAGLPVLTSRGPTPWSMTGAAVVSAYAPDAEIARDADSLVRLAERYAPSMRDAWRARRSKSALFDVPKFTRAFLQRLHML